MDEIFGLPAHPFFLHFPIVAIPLLTILVLVMVAKPSKRNILAPVTAGVSVITFVSTYLATLSGEELSETLGLTESIKDHEDYANALTTIVFGIMLFAIAYAVITRKGINNTIANYGLRGVLSTLGVLAVIYTVLTGHEGSKQHWDGILPDDEVAIEDLEDETEDPVDPGTTEAPSTTITEARSAEVIYAQSCAVCHGDDGTGTEQGQNLTPIDILAPSIERAKGIVINGDDGMPAFGETAFTDEELTALIELVFAF